MILAHTPAAIFARWLVAQGFGVLSTATTPPDWTITVDALPADDPDNRIALFNAGAEISRVILSTGETIEKPHMQIRARSKSNQTAYVKLAAIQEVFQEISPRSRAEITMSNPTRTYWLESVTIAIPIIRLPSVEENDKRFNFVQTVKLVFGEP